MASAELLDKYKFEMEKAEERYKIPPLPTGFPAPTCRTKLIFGSPNMYLEQYYYWIHDHIQYDWGFSKADKITDIFAAGEQSAFFGVSEQRLGMQQDKASQYLKGISEMLKALFQIVREIRIIDERLDYYYDTYKRGKEAISSEITLKGIWIDQVEGGVKNAGSVYGLAQTVGFSILPDLFFRVKIDDKGFDEKLGTDDFMAAFQQKQETVPKLIDTLIQDPNFQFNEKVKEVLARKLSQYYMWKSRTFIELYNRKRFTIKYLRQHYDTIKLYMGWVKPYLRNIKRLQTNEKLMDNAEIISAFEGSLIEIEVLHQKPSDKAYFPCISAHFLFTTKPSMTYTAEGYQRGPGHTGKMQMTLRGYVWSQKQVDNYKRMKEEEDLELLGSINQSMNDALMSLKDDLMRYLKDEGEKFDELKKAEKKNEDWGLDPFISIFKGFKEIFSPLMPNLSSFKPKEKDNETRFADYKAAEKDIRFTVYQVYKNFKKAHKLLSW